MGHGQNLPSFTLILTRYCVVVRRVKGKMTKQTNYEII